MVRNNFLKLELSSQIRLGVHEFFTIFSSVCNENNNLYSLEE